MAFMNQEMKSKLSPAVKSILKKYEMKGSLSVRNHMVLVMKIKSGKLNLIDNFNDACSRVYGERFNLCEGSIQVNQYHFKDQFTGKAKAFITELVNAMNVGNWDKSDIQTDYFNVGWYLDINIGGWNTPYMVTQ